MGLGLWPHAPELSHRKGPYEDSYIPLGNKSKAVRLIHIGSDLCEQLIWSDAYGACEPCGGMNLPLDLSCYLFGRSRDLRDVEKGLVNTHVFEYRGDFPESGLDDAGDH